MSLLSSVRLNLRWLVPYAGQALFRRRRTVEREHLIIALADHFEPSIVPNSKHGTFAPLDEQERRLERWCRSYPAALGEWRDSEGRPLVHTCFYPAEQYHAPLIERLADFCHQGWGEIEIHLHHGHGAPDTPENTRRQLIEFRDILASHGCLSRSNGDVAPRYAFVHGNWALANSGEGKACGVDNEMQILAETGCYADMTLPSAPNVAQISKINSMYECALPLDQRAPHREGHDLRIGRAPKVFPLMIQGPLLLNIGSSGRLKPRIENGEISGRNPASMRRLQLWKRAGIIVSGRPDWIFIKLHCHGMDPRDETGMTGEPMRRFLRELTEDAKQRNYGLHFVTAREMTNMALAACDGREGNPGDYRDYRFQLTRASSSAGAEKPLPSAVAK